jgi:predicted TPR repeat methyltransferase
VTRPNFVQARHALPSPLISVVTSSTIDPSQTFQSSGDLIADRRFSYAEALADEGDLVAAADLLVQVLERVPDWPPAWFKLGLVEDERGSRDASCTAFARALALDPQDALGASLHLARLGVAASPKVAPEAYVRGLFDQYAGRFDGHLLDGLAYRGPDLLRAAVLSLGERHFAHAIDLGCGTGLGGTAFRAATQLLTGVDLSAGMIAQARDKGLYDRLELANIQAFLAAEPAASADLLIAADVLCYVGDLAPIMRAAQAVLELGGLFVFTLQKGESAFGLGADLRFAHAPSYVRAISAAQGLTIAILDEAPLRRDAGADVVGLVVVLRKDR